MAPRDVTLPGQSLISPQPCHSPLSSSSRLLITRSAQGESLGHLRGLCICKTRKMKSLSIQHPNALRLRRAQSGQQPGVCLQTGVICAAFSGYKMSRPEPQFRLSWTLEPDVITLPFLLPGSPFPESGGRLQL